MTARPNRAPLSFSRRLFYSHLLCALLVAMAVSGYLLWALQPGDGAAGNAEALQAIRVRALLGFIGAVVLAMLFARVSSAQISARISSFVEPFRRISAGNYDVRVDQSTDDALGDMARAFNQMSEKLRSHVGERERNLIDLCWSQKYKRTYRFFGIF